MNYTFGYFFKPRKVAPAALEIINDGSTVAWYDYLLGITKNGSDLVSNWADQSGSGNDLVQAGADALKPTWNANGVLFDGVATFMKAVAFTLVQPEFVYIVFKQVTWVNFDRIFQGETDSSSTLFQYPTTPSLLAHSGNITTADGNLPLNTYGIARVLFNGASSTLQINSNTKITADFGSNNMGGFALGGRIDANDRYSNIEVKEVIIRNVADTTQDEGTIYNYLANKYGI